MPWPSEPDYIRAAVSEELCLGVRVVDEDDKRALAQGWPDAVLVTDGRWMEPKILIRLAHIDPQQLDELVTESWRTQAPKDLVRELDTRASRET